MWVIILHGLGECCLSSTCFMVQEITDSQIVPMQLDERFYLPNQVVNYIESSQASGIGKEGITKF